jgi:hypothetical protein
VPSQKQLNENQGAEEIAPSVIFAPSYKDAAN